MENKVISVDGKDFIEYLSAEEIAERVHFLGLEITKAYADQNPLFIVVLNGAYVFAADLLREISFSCDICFVRLKSYNGLRSSENIEEVLGLDKAIEGRNVVLIEDIIDTGNTLDAFLPQLESLNPESIRLATLLFKEAAFKHDFEIDYIGFKIDPLFVIGYGMDYNDFGRNLKSVYQLKKVE